MPDKKNKKREELRTRLIEAAQVEIIEHGLRGLKARAVTTRAGCSLGGLYNAVEDLNQLVMLVNSRTLKKLGDRLKNAGSLDASPVDAMQNLAGTYVDFALENTALWSAVFNHRLPDGVEFPEWHTAEYPVLISEIIAPLSKLRPDLPPDALRLRAQTLFASVHGVVQLAIHGRFVGVPISMLKSEVSALVDAMASSAHIASQNVD